MYFAELIEDGKVLELKWMWLPAFISQNYALMRKLADAWKLDHPQGIKSTLDAEEKTHQWVCHWLGRELKIKGLEDYLLCLKYIEET